MYISYKNRRNGKIVTRFSIVTTQKNQKELEKRMSCFNYLYEKAVQLLESEDISANYRTEIRVKKNNSRRRIDIPNDDLMRYQREVVEIFSNKLNLLFPNTVFGYVKGRNAKMLAEEHKNQFQIIKLDIKNFFPSCTLEFIMNSMYRVYPFCLLSKELIETILKPCMIFYDGKYRLPQGAPTSPILANIAMIPLDYELEMECINNGYKYSRFADDIIISHGLFYDKSGVDAEKRILTEIFGETIEEKEMQIKDIRTIAKKMINTIVKILKEENPEFELNKEKTKVLNTNCGNIWMLGVTVGCDVKIGNKKKQRFKASIWSFLNDCKNSKPWNVDEARHLMGIIGYYKFIEPDFVNQIISKYEQKTGLDFRREVKKILCM